MYNIKFVFYYFSEMCAPQAPKNRNIIHVLFPIIINIPDFKKDNNENSQPTSFEELHIVNKGQVITNDLRA